MRALVISGGGSKGAFAGGVAQYLIEEKKKHYDLLLGTSTGSLLIPHLALNKSQKIKDIFTSVDQNSIFSNLPFVIKRVHGYDQISINHFNVIRNFIQGKKTFGESLNLKSLIRESLTENEFRELRARQGDIVITVSNLSLNEVEYKSIKDFEYDDFCDWIWISCNYTPFMSLVQKNGCEYADGGLGSMVPIEEAIKRGATEIDAIVLQTEVTYFNRMPSKNVFALIINLFSFVLDRIEHQNIRIGKFAAANKDVIINFYYTPTVLTTNSLIFDKKKMESWWETGYSFGKLKDDELNQIEP
ncbi:patatin-like phospholipase family protein [Antarcticibacterium arcticum]|uniref:Patatin-like phospholipase family protein n=1 Tax=Antarcticibacterium arcticum TaxID=2585771 RepID=A0A5B8YMR5_9FLAO|nr:patatin-like phospholipase family protein [Antarcticibacterium arcticum]QED37546.1 patatin-like phospholipase family protein [Antarcticibacterium arcticum]